MSSKRSQPAHGSETAEERFRREAEYFDAAEYPTGPIDPRTIERYQDCRKPWFPNEYLFRVIGDLKGKRVLEVGCGGGGNSVLLAKKGATVVAVDVSEAAIQAARQLAENNGVGSLVEFECTPFELFESRAQFDVIFGEAVLHHVLPELDNVLAKLVKLAKPGALFAFKEPVNIWPLWRKFRLALPIATTGTPDERPLEARELELVSSKLGDFKIRYFDTLGRMGRFVLVNYNFEKSSRARQSLTELFFLLDYFFLTFWPFKKLAGSSVITGKAR